MARRQISGIDWANANTVRGLLELLFPDERSTRGAATQRKLRLQACAWADIYPADERYDRMLLTGERYAASECARAELVAASREFWTGFDRGVLLPDDRRFTPAATACDKVIHSYSFFACGDEFIDLRVTPFVRDLFPDPSAQPVKVPKKWRTATVTALARGCYDDRAFDRLPVLADALEDAGCDSAPLLTYLRGPGPHVRGCWALDAVLGL